VVPHALRARAYRRNLRQRGTALLGYGDLRGHPRLRTALLSFLNETRGLSASPDEIVVTRGSQMALDLLARVLVRPGDVPGPAFPATCARHRPRGPCRLG